MKRLFLIIASFIIVGSSSAQSDRAVNIYTSEGLSMFFMSDIDSITHDSDNILIHFNNSYSIYPNEEIDSIVFSENTTSYYFPIMEEGLEGWSEGYMNNQGYFIVGRQEEDGGYFVYIGQKDQLDDGITLKFNDTMEMQNIYCSKGLMQIIEDESTPKKYALYILSDSIYVEEFNMPNVSRQVESNGYRRIPTRLNNVLDLMNTGGDVNNFLSWASGNRDLSTFLANLVPNLMLLPSWGTLGLSLGLNYLDERYQEQLYEILYKYMGDAQIWIYIDDSNAPNFQIKASIEGLDVSGKPMYCSAHTGIAVGINNPVVLYDKCDFILKEHETKTNEVYYADLRAERKTNYYLTPFVIIKVDGIGGQFPLTRPRHLWGGPAEMIIHYGNMENICYDVYPSATTGDVVSTTMTSAVVNCSYNGVNGYECGVMVTRADGTGERKDFKTNSEDGERPVTLTELEPATAYKYCAYVYADGELFPGNEWRDLVTNSPSLAGTWNCTITRSSITRSSGVESWSITLTGDGNGIAKRTDTSSADYEASWSVGADGQAYVDFAYIVSTPQRFSYQTYSLWGTVNSIDSPSSISGNGEYRIGNDIAESGPYRLTFTMSK